MSDLHWMTATEAAQAITARKLSPVELMKLNRSKVWLARPRPPDRHPGCPGAHKQTSGGIQRP
jgi:hypothetical protein